MAKYTTNYIQIKYLHSVCMSSFSTNHDSLPIKQVKNFICFMYLKKKPTLYTFIRTKLSEYLLGFLIARPQHVRVGLGVLKSVLNYISPSEKSFWLYSTEASKLFTLSSVLSTAFISSSNSLFTIVKFSSFREESISCHTTGGFTKIWF